MIRGPSNSQFQKENDPDRLWFRGPLTAPYRDYQWKLLGWFFALMGASCFIVGVLAFIGIVFFNK